MENKERQDRIEQYLREEMSPAERARFEEKMRLDPELSAEVGLHRELQDEFGDREKQEFIKGLDALSDRHFGPPEPPDRKGWNWNFITGFILAAAVVVWLISRFISAPVDRQPAPATESSELPAPVEEDQPLPGSPGRDIEQQAPVSPPGQDEQVTPPPIARLDPADFTPNPYLEDLIGSSFRGESLQFSGVSATVNGGRFLVEGQIRMTGTSGQDLLVLVYSNKEADWLDGAFLLRRKPDLQPLQEEKPLRAADGTELSLFRFRLDEPVEWKPGLYYYFLAREQEEEPLFTGKVELTAD